MSTENQPSTPNITEDDRRAEHVQVEKRASRFIARRRANLEGFKHFKHDLGLDGDGESRNNASSGGNNTGSGGGGGDAGGVEGKHVHKKKRKHDFSKITAKHTSKKKNRKVEGVKEEDEAEDEDKEEEAIAKEEMVSEETTKSHSSSASTNVGNIFFSTRTGENATMKKCLLRANQFKQEKLKKKNLDAGDSANPGGVGANTAPFTQEDLKNFKQKIEQELFNITPKSSTTTTTTPPQIEKLVKVESSSPENGGDSAGGSGEGAIPKKGKKSRKIVRKQSCMEIIYNNQKNTTSANTSTTSTASTTTTNPTTVPNSKIVRVQLESKMKDIDCLREIVAHEIIDSSNNPTTSLFGEGGGGGGAGGMEEATNGENLNNDREFLNSTIPSVNGGVGGGMATGSNDNNLESPDNNDFEEIAKYYKLPIIQKLVVSQIPYWQQIADQFRKSGGVIHARTPPEETYDSIANQLWEPYDGRPVCALGEYGQCIGQLTMRYNNGEGFALMAYMTTEQLDAFIQKKQLPEELLMCEFCHRFYITLMWKINPCNQNFTFHDLPAECTVHHTYRVGVGNYAYDGMLAQSGKMKTHGVFGLVRAWNAGDFIADKKTINVVDPRDGRSRPKTIRGWRETSYLFAMNSNRSTVVERADPMERSVVRPSEPMTVQWFLRCYFSQNMKGDGSGGGGGGGGSGSGAGGPPISSLTTFINSNEFKKREQILNEQLRTQNEIDSTQKIWFTSFVHRCAFEEFYDLLSHVGVVDWHNEENRYFWQLPLHALDPLYTGEKKLLIEPSRHHPSNIATIATIIKKEESPPPLLENGDEKSGRDLYFEINQLPPLENHQVYYALMCKLNAIRWFIVRFQKKLSRDLNVILEEYFKSFLPLLRWMFSSSGGGDGDATRILDSTILTETIEMEMGENFEFNLGVKVKQEEGKKENQEPSQRYIPIFEFYPRPTSYDDPRYYHFIEWRKETFTRQNPIEELQCWYGETHLERVAVMEGRKLEIEPFIAPLRNKRKQKERNEEEEGEVAAGEGSESDEITFELFSAMLEHINLSSIVLLQKHGFVERFIRKFSNSRTNVKAREKFEKVYAIVAHRLYTDEKEIQEYILFYFDKIFIDFNKTVQWVASTQPVDVEMIDRLFSRSGRFSDLFSSNVTLSIPFNWREMKNYNVLVAALVRVWVAERLHELEIPPKANVFKHSAKNLECVGEGEGKSYERFQEKKSDLLDFGLATMRFALIKFRNAHLDLLSLVREGKDGCREPLLSDSELYYRDRRDDEKKFSKFDLLYPYPTRDVDEGILPNDSNALLYVDFINETGMKFSIWNKIMYKLPDRCCSGRNGDDILDTHCASNPTFYRTICLELELSFKGAYLHCNQRPRFKTTLELHRVFKNLYAPSCRKRILQIMIHHHKLTMFALSECLVYLLSKNTSLFKVLNDIYPEWYGERVKCNMDIARIALDETWNFDTTDTILFDKVNLERNKRVYRHLASDFIEYLCKQIEKLDVERYEQAQYFKDKRYKTNECDRAVIERIVHNSNPQDVVDLAPLEALGISDETMIKIVRMNRIFYEHKSQKEIQQILKSLSAKEYNLISFFLETLKRYRAIRTVRINNYDIVNRQIRAVENFYISSLGERKSDGISSRRFDCAFSLCCKQALVLISNTVDSQGSGFQGTTESLLRNGQVCKRKEDRLKKKRKAEGKKNKRRAQEQEDEQQAQYEKMMLVMGGQGQGDGEERFKIITQPLSFPPLLPLPPPKKVAAGSTQPKMRRLTRRKNQTEEAFRETVAKAQKIEKKSPLCNETKILFVPAAGCVVECPGYKILSGKKSNAKSKKNIATKKINWNIVHHPECERSIAVKQLPLLPPPPISTLTIVSTTISSSSTPDTNMPQFQPYRVLSAEEVKEIHELKVGSVFTRPTILKHHYKKKGSTTSAGGGGGGGGNVAVAGTNVNSTNNIALRNAIENWTTPSPITIVNLFNNITPNCIFDYYDQIENSAIMSILGHTGASGGGTTNMKNMNKKFKKPTSTKTTIENLWKQSGSPFFISPCCGRWTSYRVFNFTSIGYFCGSCSKGNSIVTAFRKPLCIICFNAEIELANATWHKIRVFDDVYTGRRIRYYFCTYCMSSKMMLSRNFLDVPLSILCKGIKSESYLQSLVEEVITVTK